MKFIGSFFWDYDFANRLHCLWTPLVLFLACLLSVLRTELTSPMECWLQPEIEMKKPYVNSICWSAQTYFLPMDNIIPNQPMLPKREINYIPWIPFLFLAQMLLVFNVRWLVRVVNRLLSADVFSDVMKTLENRENCSDSKEREELLEYAAGKTTSTQMAFLGILTIFLTKVLYLVLALSQLALLDSVLNYKNRFYAFRVLVELLMGQQWPQSVYLPRVVLCDYEIRQQSRAASYTSQCTVNMSQFYEKLFFFLWFFMLFLLFVGIFSVGKLLVRFLTSVLCRNKQFGKEIRAIGGDNEPCGDGVDNFVHKLKIDEALTLWLIADNFGQSTMSQVLHKMWQKKSQEEPRTHAKEV